jgi:hypothetical protein
MKKCSPSYGQNGQLVHWWVLGNAIKLKAVDFTRVIRAFEAKVSTNLVPIKAHR